MTFFLFLSDIRSSNLRQYRTYTQYQISPSLISIAICTRHMCVFMCVCMCVGGTFKQKKKKSNMLGLIF